MIYHRLHLWLFIFNPYGVGCEIDSVCGVCQLTLEDSLSIYHADVIALV